MYGLHMYGKNALAAVAGMDFQVVNLIVFVNFHICRAGIAAVLVRQTSIVCVILVAVGCFYLSLQKLMLSTKDRKFHILSSWHQVQVNKNMNRILIGTIFKY